MVQPVAGILDVLDNYAFVRTSGYLAGPNDVYVSMDIVRKNGCAAVTRSPVPSGCRRMASTPISGTSTIRWSASTA